MKNLVKIFIITAGFVSFLSVNSFALVDAAGWGGYGFNSTLEDNTGDEPKGGQYGVKAHYNTSFIPFIELGLGGYYQYTKLKYDILNDENDVVRKSAGLDVNFILTIPIVHPYVRGTYALWDKLDNDKKKYKAYGVGGGVEFTVFPFIRIFGEYMHDHSDHDSNIKSDSANFGLKVDI